MIVINGRKISLRENGIIILLEFFVPPYFLLPDLNNCHDYHKTQY